MAVARPCVGAHVSTAGGLVHAVDRAVDIGAHCVQIFVSAPQQWRQTQHKDADVAAFREGLASRGLAPVFIHAVYLLNLASPNEELRRRSVEVLLSHLRVADQIGAAGVIFHPGSHTGSGDEAGEQAIVNSLRFAMRQHDGPAGLLLETTAGSKGIIGGTFEQLARLIERLGGGARLQVCLDTAHVFEAGYDCITADGVNRMLTRFDETVGLSRLTCVHANDSKTPFASHVDRHANIGEGHIGRAGFWHLLHDPTIAARPLVLEVPGFTGEGPDRPNVDLLRAIAAAPSPEVAQGLPLLVTGDDA
ncbi:MAG: deoxyribonuclease IV [Chloroflexi bacterium]|nr:deoxyribonuclease IV [Chloroflexota bacterium]